MQRAGARLLDEKAPDTPDAGAEIKAEVAKIGARIDTVEKIVQSFAESSAAQTHQLKELINRIPVQDGIPPITGLKFIRDEEGFATGITFIRDKTTVN